MPTDQTLPTALTTRLAWALLRMRWIAVLVGGTNLMGLIALATMFLGPPLAAPDPVVRAMATFGLGAALALVAVLITLIFPPPEPAAGPRGQLWMAAAAIAVFPGLGSLVCLAWSLGFMVL